MRVCMHVHGCMWVSTYVSMHVCIFIKILKIVPFKCLTQVLPSYNFLHTRTALKKLKPLVGFLPSKYLIICWALPNKFVSSLILLVRQRWTFSSSELKWKSMYLSMSGSMTSPDSVSRGQRSLISTTSFPVWMKKQQQIKLTFNL